MLNFNDYKTLFQKKWFVYSLDHHGEDSLFLMEETTLLMIKIKQSLLQSILKTSITQLSELLPKTNKD